MQEINILSWNVNGIRSINKKEKLVECINENQPDIICLQEVRADTTTTLKELRKVADPNVYPHVFIYTSIVKKGYSGTAIVSKLKPINDLSSMFDSLNAAKDEGRVTCLEYGTFVLVNTYTPNSGAQLGRLEYRTQIWDQTFANILQQIKTHKPKKTLIIAGDLNVAHNDIDIHSPKTNQKSAGFTPEERQSFSSLLNATKLIDTFRYLNPQTQKFSYWSNFFKAREKNKGWRIDYFLCDTIDKVKHTDILDTIHGSDHAPIVLKFIVR